MKEVHDQNNYFILVNYQKKFKDNSIENMHSDVMV